MKTKTLTKLTLKEYNEYSNILSDDDTNIVGILELFGYDVNEMSVSEFNQAQDLVLTMKIEDKKIKPVYKIGNKRFKVCLSIPKIKAGQFIDFQQYIEKKNLEQILSVFLIPQYRTWYGGWKTYKYGEGYDVFEVQEHILNNMLIEDVNALAGFFLRQCQSLLKVTQDYLTKKLVKKKLQMIKEKLEVK